MNDGINSSAMHPLHNQQSPIDNPLISHLHAHHFVTPSAKPIDGLASLIDHSDQIGDNLHLFGKASYHSKQ